YGKAIVLLEAQVELLQLGLQARQLERHVRLWGEYMAGTAMLSSFCKGDERVKLLLRSPAVHELYVEAAAVGEVRDKAVLSSSTLKGLESSADASSGSMQVSKVLYGASKPYETTIQATGIAEADFQTFYDVSEQVPTVVRISSDMSGDRAPLCCGVTIQKMREAAPHGRVYELQDLRFDAHPLQASAVATNEDLLAYLKALIPNAGEHLEQSCRRTSFDVFDNNQPRRTRQGSA
ncbi:hypothetical protein PybrP1_010747, partial [[Pythium] brassicae (nom. inval.)]